MEKEVHLKKLLKEVRACRVCELELPFGVRPILRAHPSAKILLIGQAPGINVHQSGTPWDDLSGDRLREWMQVDRSLFYNEKHIAITPMGFCYPGKGDSGDLPPRKECAPLWHPRLLSHLPHLKLIVLIGTYAQRFYLREKRGASLTQTVRNAASYLPYFPIVHPSPRNLLWHKRNLWFEKETVPSFREKLHEVLKS